MMKYNLKYIREAKTFMSMLARVNGCKAELREIEGLWKTYFGKDADALVPIKELLG